MKIKLALILCGLIFTACSNKIAVELSNNPKVESVVHAQNFKLIQHPTFIELQIIDPEKGLVERCFALFKNGKDAALAPGMERIDLPVKKFVCLSATHIGMLQKLNSIDLIKGVGVKQYVYNLEILKKITEGKVEEFKSIDQLNPERLLKLGVEVVIYDGFGTYPANEEKLKKLGIVCIPNYDWRETNPLGKAEWIKLFGVLSGKGKEANAYFSHISKAYSRLKKEAQNLRKHTTMISGSMIGDLWYMPAGQSFSSNIFKDAQFDYKEKNSKGTGSVSFSFEHCLKQHKNVNVWINPGVISYRELLRLNSNYRYFKPFQTKEIYCYSHAANYFWENSVVEPHHLLSDYISINKGEGSRKKLYFYRKLIE